MLTDDELYKINKIINSTYLDGEKYSHFKALSLALERIARDKESAISICGDDLCEKKYRENNVTMRNIGNRDLDEIMVRDKDVICGDDEYCQRIVQTLSQKLYPKS